VLDHERLSTPNETTLRDTHRRFCSAPRVQGTPAYSTTCKALHDKLLYTSKRSSGRAVERDDAACEQWAVWFHAKYQADQVVAVDETSNDDRVKNRAVAISRRGTKAIVKKKFHRGTRYSAMAGYTVLDGFLPPFITKETFTGPRFLAGLRRAVFPHMGRYPGPRSVLLLDNAKIHGCMREVIDETRALGARVVFLEPYDPEHMPIELGFRAYKNDRRDHPQRYEDMSEREALRAGLLRVGTPGGARANFREAGFPNV
jgi:hypothetical protein